MKKIVLTAETVIRPIVSSLLKSIECTKGVKVICAVESGSRSWGFPSADSDFDVRFIYVNPPEYYLTVKPKRDVLEVPTVKHSDFVLDLSGWDLRKALFLLCKSNPTLLEWLNSPVVYYAEQKYLECILDLATYYYSPFAAYHHYVSMAKNNKRNYLDKGELTAKKYLYVIRALLAAQWCSVRYRFVPVPFEVLISLLNPPDWLIKEINKLLEIKLKTKEKSEHIRLERVDAWIEARLEGAYAETGSISKGAFPNRTLDKANGFLFNVVREMMCGG